MGLRDGEGRRTVLQALDDDLEAWLMIVLLGAATVIVFAQVIMRYFFGNSLSWSEEAARYLFIWLIYIGISYAAKHDKHIKVDMLLNVGFMSTLDRKLVCLVSDVVFLAFAGIIVYLGYQYVEVLYQRDQRTASLFGLPIWVIYAAFPVGYALCSWRLIQNLVRRVTRFSDDSVFPFDRDDAIEGEKAKTP